MTCEQKAPQRRYALTKLNKGDYLLPGNDAKSVWRISQYEEDGSLERGDDGTVVIGTFWQVARLADPVLLSRVILGNIDHDDMELLDGWSVWEIADGPLSTRKAAIESALRMM